MKKTPTVAILLFWLISSSGGEEVQTSDSLPAPNIYLIPNRRIMLRENATIFCTAPVFSRLYFYLEKDAQIITTATERISEAASFYITNISTEQGGVYKCCYNSSGLSPATCSEPLELLITDPSLPGPTINLIPRKIVHKGFNVSFSCSAMSPTQGFYLYKDGHKRKDLPVELHKENATFSIRNVNRSNGGKYSCAYTSSSYPFISESSNEVELFVVDSTFPRPAISPSPIMLVPPGGNATIQCKSEEPSMKFFYLQKSGDEMPQQSLETNGTVAEFHIMNANKNHTGEYSCRYSTKSAPFIISKMSNLTRLVITDPHLPKPSVSLIPDRIVMLTGRMRIECTANRSGNRFYLYKGIDKKQLQIVITDGDRVLFPINNLHKEDAGSFSCSYMNQSEFFTASGTSDVTLLVTDPSLSKPNIFSENMKFVALESNISINCGLSNLNGKYFLLKDDRVMSHNIPEANETTFVIGNATLAHGGKYACSYSRASQPFVISLRSKYVTIQISDPTLPKPSISLSPSKMTRLGSNISILCRVHDLNNAFHPNSTFYLYKIYEIENTGDEEDHEPQMMQPDNDTAEFSISIVKEEQGGKYHCCYKPPSGSLMSEPSDSLEIFLLNPKLDRPAISKSGNTMIGENVTISCTISRTHVNFSLHKNGNPIPDHAMMTYFDMGTFSIINISLEDSGNYSCSYTITGKPFVYSPPSEILLLLVSEKPDYTTTNIIHCVIGALVLLLLGILVTLDCHSTKVYEVNPQQRSKEESLSKPILSRALDADPDPAPQTNQE